MPIQAPQWTDYLICMICLKKYGRGINPINLGCGHTACEVCVRDLTSQQCPFDQVAFTLNESNLVVNTAILQLAGVPPPEVLYHPPSLEEMSESELLHYDMVVRKFEQLALLLPHKDHTSKLSKPMQRKIVQLIQCSLLNDEGRKKVLRAIRNLADRSITETLLLHQNPQQLGANLWAAVRARGCQFLGPSIQEEVLHLVLLALEDGFELSRRVLVMFVVQRLETLFPHASKTSIGHVVQLLYRASCFRVSKRESSSSLMQLKEEYRTYDSLRREHDAQIVQIAQDAGLRIAPDQWSCLLYGDASYRGHMQSIIDKMHSPQTFHQSTRELMILYKRSGCEERVAEISGSLQHLCSMDQLLESDGVPTFKQLSQAIDSFNVVINDLLNPVAIRKGAVQSPTQSSQEEHLYNTKIYKNSMCYYIRSGRPCYRGSACVYAHSLEDLERIRNRNRSNIQPGPLSCRGPSVRQRGPLVRESVAMDFSPSTSHGPSSTNERATSTNERATSTNERATSTNERATSTNERATSTNERATLTNERATSTNEPTASTSDSSSSNNQLLSETVQTRFNYDLFGLSSSNSGQSSSEPGPSSARQYGPLARPQDLDSDDDDTNLPQSVNPRSRAAAIESLEERMRRYETSMGDLLECGVMPLPRSPRQCSVTQNYHLDQMGRVIQGAPMYFPEQPPPYQEDDPHAGAIFTRYPHPPPPPPYTRFQIPIRVCPIPHAPPCTPDVNWRAEDAQRVHQHLDMPTWRMPMEVVGPNVLNNQRQQVESQPENERPHWRLASPSSHRDNFIRSFSILTCESDHVPFDQSPSTSYGPISRASVDSSPKESGRSDVSQQERTSTASVTNTINQEQQQQEPKEESNTNENLERNTMPTFENQTEEKYEAGMDGHMMELHKKLVSELEEEEKTWCDKDALNQNNN